MHVCALSFLSKFPRNRCPARLSRVMLNLQPADNSIAPPVVRPAPCCACCRTAACFNPRTRVGCDSHAAFGKLIAFVVSIHAPAWGATPDIPAFTSPISRFNPRTRVGCDHVWGDDMPDEGRFQSTHPRGVRLHPDSPPLGQMGFNPRTRVGCDRASEGRIPISMRFQSTHPRGVRRPANAPVSRASAVSIHAPAWGATLRS